MKCLYLILSVSFGKSSAFLPLPAVSTSSWAFQSHRHYEGIITKATTSDGDQSAQAAIDWIKKEPLESILPKENVLAIISEVLADDSLIEDSEILVKNNWDSLEKRLREETRTCSDILGEESTDKVLDAVKSLDTYDPQSVRAFLSSSAVTDLFSKILYDGIFEFFQKIDVFGNIVNSLPIIGPIRKQIVAETKKQLDRSLGPLVQNFLGTYTKIAVAQASEYILSPSNRKSFGIANARLVSNILDRPINSLLPPSGLSDDLRVKAFEYLRGVKTEDLTEYVDFVYDLAGDKNVDRFVDVDRVIQASPTLQRSIDSVWTRALEAKKEDS